MSSTLTFSPEEAMFNVATEVWNQVAMEQDLRTSWAKERFLMAEEDLDRALEEEARRLKAAGESATVILAYQMVLPQLLEQPALRAHVRRHPELESAFPEITQPGAINSALKLMVKEYRLDKKEVSRLRSLLNESVKTLN